ncbi:MAG: site-2 protease family protein, partial [Nitrospirae bacterium]
MRRYLLPLVLFCLTVLSTLFAGALQKGLNPISDVKNLLAGVPFSLSLMSILLAHEFAHFFASKFNRVEATLPHFIPVPSIIGTFGAFIKMKSPIVTRKALVEIGASGPLAGFVVALFVSAYGLSLSEVVAVKDTGAGLVLGDSIVFKGLSWLILGNIPEGKDVLLHPVAFAGWIGMFVTAMNLLPIGQLDGGHIAYALLGPKLHRNLSFSLATILGFTGAMKVLFYMDSFKGPLFDLLRDNLWE